MVRRSFLRYSCNFITVMSVVLIISLIANLLIDCTLDTESETCAQFTVTLDWFAGMLTYTVSDLRLLEPVNVAVRRTVRKAIFSLQLWKPRGSHEGRNDGESGGQQFNCIWSPSIAAPAAHQTPWQRADHHGCVSIASVGPVSAPDVERLDDALSIAEVGNNKCNKLSTMSPSLQCIWSSAVAVDISPATLCTIEETSSPIPVIVGHRPMRHQSSNSNRHSVLRQIRREGLNNCGVIKPLTALSLYVLHAAALSKPQATDHLSADLNSYNSDVAVITETHFKSKHSDSVVGINGYTVFRRD